MADKVTLFPEFDKKTFSISFKVDPIVNGLSIIQAHNEYEAVKKWKKQNRFAVIDKVKSIERKES